MKPVGKMEFHPGQIDGVIVRDLHKLVDERGWLTEIFRQDELDAEYHPAMAYVSMSLPGVVRGPHTHLDQADLFAFLGPSNFKLRIWDIRQESQTYGCELTLFIGEASPALVLIPKGLVHAYQNIGSQPGWVLNCPNRLYAGAGRKERVDEIRHEDDAQTPFQMND